jgi:hypothetical protein
MNPKSIRRLLIAVFSVAAAVFSFGLSSAAQAATVSNVDTPISFTSLSPCTSELIAFSGVEHDTLNMTFDNSGGVHVELHINFQNVSGTGLSSGTTYQLPSTLNQTYNAQPGLVETTTFTEPLIAPGPGNNLFLHETAHITVNPDGTVTSSFDNSTVTCQ